MARLKRIGGIWIARRGNDRFESKSYREALLWAMGYGCDQAAGLRFAMRKKA